MRINPLGSKRAVAPQVGGLEVGQVAASSKEFFLGSKTIIRLVSGDVLIVPP
jgi:hypothetical protein